MKLDLKSLLDGKQFAEDFSYDFQADLQEMFGIGKPGATKINVSGKAQNTLGFFEASLCTVFTLEFLCDRCLTESTRDFSFTATHEFSLENLEEKDESVFISPDKILDVNSLVLGDIGLELPSKFLCKEDCKGLCSICGKNKNEEICACESKQIDPRLEALKQLLK